MAGLNNDNLEPNPSLLINDELKAARQILSALMAPNNAHVNFPFMEKIDAEALGLDDYYSVVKEPMWMRKMQQKFEHNVYRSIREFVCDFRLMLLNCYQYNGVTSRMGRFAEKLELLFEQKLQLLSPEIRAKTTIQATLGCGTTADDIAESGISRRRNTSRLFTIGDSRQATPVRALMDELEHVGSAALISGTNSSMGNNSSGNGGLWETLTSDDDGYGGVPALATSLSNEERVALIVNRLSLWRRRRHDEELIETWDEWWLSRPFKSKLHLNTIKQTPDLIEAYQLLWLADPFLGISECLNICAAANAFSSGGGLTTNVNRGLTLYELELGLIACPEGSQTLAACMSALLATPRERTNLANALASLPSVGSGQVSEINVSGSNGLSGDIDPESASTESCGNVASAQSGCATFSASISGEASPSTWSSSSLLGRFVKRRGASGSSGRSIRSLAQTVAPLPYAVWERRLAARVASWYRAMREKGKGEPSWAARRLGVPEHFFKVFGRKPGPILDMCNKNIADRIYSKAFHELSAYQRVVLIRALVESTLRAFDNLRASLDRWADWEASRPVELGYDPTDGIVYLRFPSLIDAEICTPCRIYSLPRPQAEFTFPPTWPNETQPTEALSTRTPINELALAEDNLESKDEEIGSQGQTKRRRYKRSKSTAQDNPSPAIGPQSLPVYGSVQRLPSWLDLPLARAIQLRWAEIDVARLVDAQLDREAAARLTETDSVEAEEMREPHKDSILEDNQNGIQQSDDEEGDDATTNTTTTTGTSIKTARSETDAASNSSPLDMKNQGIYQDSSEATSGAESENQNGLDRRGYRPNRGRKQRSRQRRFNNKVSRKETKVVGRRGASARVSSSGPIAARTHQLVGRSGAGARKRSKKGTNTIGDGSAEARNILLATRRLPPKLSPADLTIVGKILKEEPILNQIPSHVARMSKYLSLQLGRTSSALAKPGTYRGAATVKTNGKRGGRRGGKRSLANGASGAMDAGEETDQGEEEEEEGDEEEADEAECEGEEADAEEEGDVDVEEREDRGEEDSKNEKNRSVATMVFNETTLAINADVIKPEHSVSHEKLYSKVDMLKKESLIEESIVSTTTREINSLASNADKSALKREEIDDNRFESSTSVDSKGFDERELILGRQSLESSDTYSDKKIISDILLQSTSINENKNMSTTDEVTLKDSEEEKPKLQNGPEKEEEPEILIESPDPKEFSLVADDLASLGQLIEHIRGHLDLARDQLVNFYQVEHTNLPSEPPAPETTGVTSSPRDDQASPTQKPVVEREDAASSGEDSEAATEENLEFSSTRCRHRKRQIKTSRARTSRRAKLPRLAHPDLSPSIQSSQGARRKTRAGLEVDPVYTDLRDRSLQLEALVAALYALQADLRSRLHSNDASTVMAEAVRLARLRLRKDHEQAEKERRESMRQNTTDDTSTMSPVAATLVADASTSAASINLARERAERQLRREQRRILEDLNDDSTIESSSAGPTGLKDCLRPASPCASSLSSTSSYSFTSLRSPTPILAKTQCPTTSFRTSPSTNTSIALGPRKQACVNIAPRISSSPYGSSIAPRIFHSSGASSNGPRFGPPNISQLPSILRPRVHPPGAAAYSALTRQQTPSAITNTGVTSASIRIPGPGTVLLRRTLENSGGLLVQPMRSIFPFQVRPLPLPDSVPLQATRNPAPIPVSSYNPNVQPQAKQGLCKVYRVYDTLFTEAAQPIRLGANGALIPLSPDSVSETHRRLARQMIERYKYSRTSITPGPASLPTTVSESTTQSIPDPSSRPSLAALTSSTTTTTVSSVIPPKDDSNNYQSGRLVSWSYPQVAASSHLSSSNSSSSLSSTNHLSQSAESTSVDTSSSNCHLAQTHKQPLALSPLPSKIIISRSENTSVDHANRDSQLRTATEPSGVSDS